MAYPSVITSYTDPVASDRLNAPSHSGIERSQNAGLTAIETFVGTLSSTQGTLIYDIRSPQSNGGGHVQTAITGGTGQTTYAKGDILVAQSASTLSRLVAGTDFQILAANSSLATGIGWIDNTTNKVAASASVISIPQNTVASVYSITLPGSTLGVSNVVRATIPIPQWTFLSGNSVMGVAKYGGVVGSIMLTTIGGSVAGTMEHTIIGNNATNSQRHFIRIVGATYSGDRQANEILIGNGFNLNSVFGFHAMATSVSSVNSSGPATMGMEIRTVGTGGALTTGGYIVEKIV